MSYELKLYVGRLHSVIVDNGRTWLEEIAMVDLKSIGYESTTGNYEQHGVPSFFFAKDGDTKIIEDVYGVELQAIPIQEIVNCLEIDVKTYPNHPGFAIALTLLQSVQQFFPDACVILYGY